MNQVQHLDYDALNALKEIMEDSFALLIDTFIQDSTNRLTQLQLMVDNNNLAADSIRRAAHSFKGSCSNLGATTLANLCEQLERKAFEENLSGVAGDLDAIQQEFHIVNTLLVNYLRQ